MMKALTARMFSGSDFICSPREHSSWSLITSASATTNNLPVYLVKPASQRTEETAAEETEETTTADEAADAEETTAAVEENTETAEETAVESSANTVEEAPQTFDASVYAVFAGAMAAACGAYASLKKRR